VLLIRWLTLIRCPHGVSDQKDDATTSILLDCLRVAPWLVSVEPLRPADAERPYRDTALGSETASGGGAGGRSIFTGWDCRTAHRSSATACPIARRIACPTAATPGIPLMERSRSDTGSQHMSDCRFRAYRQLFSGRGYSPHLIVSVTEMRGCADSLI
jgi:hypothetical protein